MRNLKEQEFLKEFFRKEIWDKMMYNITAPAYCGGGYIIQTISNLAIAETNLEDL